MLLLSGKTRLTKSNKTLETEENSKGQLSLMSIREHLSMLGNTSPTQFFPNSKPTSWSPVFILNILNGCGDFYFLFLCRVFLIGRLMSFTTNVIHTIV